MRLLTFSVLRNCKFKNLCYQMRRRYCVEVSKTDVEAVKPSKDPTFTEVAVSWPKDKDVLLRANVLQDMMVYPDFITEKEEMDLLNELEPKLRRMRYEYDHWDNAIEGFRETEQHLWKTHNEVVLSRVRATAAPRGGVTWLPYTHILDLSAAGFIKPHIDAVRFCGDTIAGLCLVSAAVMRLAHAQHKHYVVDALLPQRGLYVMRGVARYEFTHEVLGGARSRFRDNPVPRRRRVAVLCRAEPRPDQAVS